MNNQGSLLKNYIFNVNKLITRCSSFPIGLTLLLLIFISSCSSIPNHANIVDDKEIENQSDLVIFLDEIINSEENISIEVFGRKAFSPRFKQTSILTHSFYLINLCDGRYYTLSFSGTSFSFYSDGYWFLNKENDISSYKLFIEGNNIWDVTNLYSEYEIDAYQTLENVINIIKSGANYYYLDHYRKKQNYLNCNTAVTETIVINQEI